MTNTFRAIYEAGVLRPIRPLPLVEGQSVDITLTEPEIEDEVLTRMRAAKSLDELFAIADELPPPADGYDLCQALNDNRRATGEQLVYPNLPPRGVP
jgi:predicted DNA-binding antitoxin AbrB/MazE fold protein